MHITHRLKSDVKIDYGYLPLKYKNELLTCISISVRNSALIVNMVYQYNEGSSVI